MREKAAVLHSWTSGNFMACYSPLRSSLSALSASLLCAGALLLPLHASAADDNKSQLKSIQQDIAEKEKSVRLQKEQRSKLLDQLQSQEKLIADASRKLRQMQQSLTRLNKEIDSLNRSIAQLQKQQAQQEILLAQQLDAAFRQGKHSGLQLLLGGEESQRSERILSYFGYLNEARQKTIGDLQQTRRDLATQKTDLQNKQYQQKTLLSDQQTQQTRLEEARVARKKTLTTLENALEKDQADLVEMRQNESRLQDKIARAEREAKARAEREAREAEQVRKRQAQAKAKGS
ncbi:MAG: murein hydrolase activator EnvC, partial [Mixta sp.]